MHILYMSIIIYVKAVWLKDIIKFSNHSSLHTADKPKLDESEGMFPVEDFVLKYHLTKLSRKQMKPLFPVSRCIAKILVSLKTRTFSSQFRVAQRVIALSLSFVAGPVCSSFSAEPCAILQADC